jgi:hypothetical protein
MHSIAPKSHHLADRPRTRLLPSSLVILRPPLFLHLPNPHRAPSLNILGRAPKNARTNFSILVKIGDPFYHLSIIDQGFIDPVDNI